MALELEKRFYDFRYLIRAGSLSVLGSLNNSEVTIFQVPIRNLFTSQTRYPTVNAVFLKLRTVTSRFQVLQLTKSTAPFQI